MNPNYALICTRKKQNVFSTIDLLLGLICFFVVLTGCSLVRLKCWSGGPESVGSNPAIPTFKQKPKSCQDLGFFVFYAILYYTKSLTGSSNNSAKVLRKLAPVTPSTAL